MCLPSDAVITGRLPYPPSSNVASGDQPPSPVAYTANTLAAELSPSTLLFFHLARKSVCLRTVVPSGSIKKPRGHC